MAGRKRCASVARRRRPAFTYYLLSSLMSKEKLLLDNNYLRAFIHCRPIHHTIFQSREGVSLCAGDIIKIIRLRHVILSIIFSSAYIVLMSLFTHIGLKRRHISLHYDLSFHIVARSLRHRHSLNALQMAQFCIYFWHCRCKQA